MKLIYSLYSHKLDVSTFLLDCCFDAQALLHSLLTTIATSLSENVLLEQDSVLSSTVGCASVFIDSRITSRHIVATTTARQHNLDMFIICSLTYSTALVSVLPL